MPQWKTSSRGLLEKVGGDGIVVNEWAKYHNEKELWCNICGKPVPIDHGSMNQLNLTHIRG